MQSFERSIRNPCQVSKHNAIYLIADSESAIHDLEGSSGYHYPYSLRARRDGKTTSFWLGHWTGYESLSQKFPAHFFFHVRQWNVTATNCYTETG
uniref:Uncharacterized protein n=1 Tax=Arundo donax TaxID=35708 RepID=A0A0A9DWC8_ARUDO